jgi:dTMP kinase
MMKRHNSQKNDQKPGKSYPGFFITLEGGEGAGKTSLIEELVKTLKAAGKQVVTTREPGGTTLGNQIRRWVLDLNEELKIFPKAELLLFLAARVEHIEELILPALKAGKIVICDRFNDSTVAYQGAARGLGADWVDALCHNVAGVVPDLTFYLDVDPKVGLSRTRSLTKENAAAGACDRIESEKIEFHEKIRQGFLSLAKAHPERIVVLDANLPQAKVVHEALQILSHSVGS